MNASHEPHTKPRLLAGRRTTPKTLIIGVLIGVVLFGSVAVMPKPAQALLGVGDVTFVTIVANPAEALISAVKKAIKLTADVAYKNTVRMFLNKVAYDSAVYIASGGKGQKPLFLTNPGNFINEVADAAVGDYLDRLSTHVFGRSLCQPIDLQTKVKLDIFARRSVEPQLPRCSITRIGQTFSDSFEKAAQGQLIEFSYEFHPEANEFGAFLSIRGDLAQARAKATEAERDKGLLGGFRAVTSPITGIVKTPASLVERGAAIPLEQAFAGYTTQTGSPIADAVGTFTNTLVSKLLQRIFARGFNPGLEGSSFAGLLESTKGGGIAAAKSIFSKLAQPDFISGGSVDIISELSSCPSGPAFNNCIVDGRFAQAVRDTLTLQEAINQGLIDPNKTFGFGANGTEPEYQNGYPYRSLVMLRKYRIVPVGWELAALYIRDFATQTFSIQEVMDKFNFCGQRACSNDRAKECDNDLQCPDNNGDGVSDGTCSENMDYSPFCGLVDPNWVLTSPEVFCKREGAGESLIAASWVDHDGDTGLLRQGLVEQTAVTPNERQLTRRQTCVDEQTCIVEGADGSCERYGYCTEERDVWRFNGDACNAQFASCQTFVDPNNTEVSYLKDTLQYNNCNASNAGCQWYCQEADASGDWQCDYGLDANGQHNRLAFDRDVSTCDGSADGCAEFIRTKPSLGTNLVRNSSFERFDHSYITDDRIDDGVVDYADPSPSHGDRPGLAPFDTGNTEHVLDVTRDAYDGQYAVKLIWDPAHAGTTWYAPHSTDTGRSLAGRTFTFSYYAKLDSCTDASITSVDSSVQLIAYPADVWLSDTPVTYKKDVWQRYITTGTASKSETRTSLQGNLRAVTNCTVVFDALQLEEGAPVTAYKGYGDVNRIYMDGGRASCNVDDVGCELYTPLSGDLAVTGKITDPSSCDPNDPFSCDQCPAEFVGCKAFREMPIEHTPRRPSREPVSFVPKTGLTCPATQLGCEEYTNLDEVARGGEGLEYYSFIRQCAKPADAGAEAANYYTWIGDEESGYQLKAFNLLRSNVVAAGTRAPCTNLAPDDPASAIQYPACVDNVTFDEDGAGPLPAVNHPIANQDCSAADLYTNPDCAEFYDSNGVTSYRLRSRIIFVTEDCHPYKNTIDTQASHDITYHMMPGESVTCSATFAGCREYQGSAGSNVRTLISTNFESGSIAPWVSNADAALNPSNYSTQAGGHSMVVFDLGFGAPPGAWTPIDGLIESDTSYVLKFWASGGSNDASIEAGIYDGAGNIITLDDGSTARFRGTAVAQAGDWNQYTLGPLFFDAAVPPGAFLFIGGTRPFYLDNLQFQEVTDDVFVVQGSYTECSGYENCEAYRDRDSRIHYLKSFSKICDADAVGCEALIQTQNNENPFPENIEVTVRPRGDYDADGQLDRDDLVQLNSYFDGRCTTGPFAGTTQQCDPENPAAICGVGNTCISGVNRSDPWAIMDVNGDSTVNGADLNFLNNYFSGGPAPVAFPTDITIPADEVVTLINDPAVYCQSNQAGCMRMGEPIINAYNSVDGYTDTYIVNDPDDYEQILCRQDESSCQEYSYDGGFAYFKDPGSATCEYNIPPGSTTAGWYRRGTDIGCGPSLTDTSIADGMVGLCPADQSGCTEYLDPLDPEGCDVNVPANQTNVGRCDTASTTPGSFCDTTAFCSAGPKFNQPCSISDPGADCGYAAPGVPFTCQIQIPHATQCGAGLCASVAACQAYYYVEPTVDTTSCNNVVDDLAGCRLFYNATTPPPTFTAKGTSDGSAPSGACDNNPNTPARPDCDSNQIIKVQRDRTCNKWLECSASTTVRNERGEEEEVCFERAPCNKLDPVSGECIGTKACSDNGRSCQRDSDCVQGICALLDPLVPEKVCSDDQSVRCTADADCKPPAQPFDKGICQSLVGADLIYTSAADASNNVNLMENISGLARAGVNWGRQLKCSNEPTQDCSSPADCGGAPCGIERLIEGNYPYSAMYELGTFGAGSKDLVKDGDFWDNSFLDSQNIKPNDSSTAWTENQSYRGWKALGTDTTARLTEMADDGSIPGNALLNENNILEVNPGDAAGAGVEYTLGQAFLLSGDYILSFKAKYENANTVDGDAITFELVQGVTTVTIGTVALTPSWDEYVLGPFDVDNTAETAVLRISQEIDSGRIFYLDDVSMKPILKVHSERGTCSNDNTKVCSTNDDCVAPGVCLGSGSEITPNKVVRTCRMYPREDSALCEYTDFDGVQYRGWKGYCVEKDPKNSNICLNWWPVDVISGETSVFGQEQQAGYTGRVPLYYCTNAKGNAFWNTDSYSTPTRLSGSLDHWCEWYARTGHCASRPIMRCSIDSECKFGFSDYGPCVGDAPSTRNSCYVEDELIEVQNDCNNQFSSTRTWFKDATGSILQRYGIRFFGDDYASNCLTTGTGFDCDTAPARMIPANDTERAINRSDIELVKVHVTSNDDFQAEEARKWTFYVSPTNYYKGDQKIWHGGTSADEGFDFGFVPQCSAGHDAADFGLRVRFDDDGFVLGYDYRAGVPSSGGEIGTLEIEYLLRESCKVVVQVAGDDVVPWTKRIAEGSSYLTHMNKYTYAQDLAPFGAIPPLIGSPEIWYGKELGTPLYVQLPLNNQTERLNQTRAGSPTICESSMMGFDQCGTPVCYGSTDVNLLGTPCADSLSKQKCESNGGWCSGPSPKPIWGGEGVPTQYIIKRFFAKAFDGWVWDNTLRKYVSDNAASGVSAWNTAFDDMQLCADGVRPPTDGLDDDFCAIPPHIGNFTLSVGGNSYRNDKAAWNVSYPAGTRVQVSFTADVNEEQMPLDAILIDWDGDDGTTNDREGSMVWGYAPRSDPLNPHTFTHIFTEAGTYIPRVQLVDHWRTCSNVIQGICSAASTFAGWRCQDADCTAGGGTCIQPAPAVIPPVITQKDTSCVGGPDDNPGWYAFNGAISIY